MILTSLIYNPFIKNIYTNYFYSKLSYIYIQQQLLKSCYMKNFLRKLSHTSYFTTLSFSPTYPNNMIHIHQDTLCPYNKKPLYTFMHSSSKKFNHIPLIFYSFFCRIGTYLIRQSQNIIHTRPIIFR